MFLHVTMPEIAAGKSIKRDVDARDHSGRTLHYVLPPGFIGIRPKNIPGKAQRSVLQQVDVAIE